METLLSLTSLEDIFWQFEPDKFVSDDLPTIYKAGYSGSLTDFLREKRSTPRLEPGKVIAGEQILTPKPYGNKEYRQIYLTSLNKVETDAMMILGEPGRLRSETSKVPAVEFVGIMFAHEATCILQGMAYCNNHYFMGDVQFEKNTHLIQHQISKINDRVGVFVSLDKDESLSRMDGAVDMFYNHLKKFYDDSVYQKPDYSPNENFILARSFA